MKFAVVGAGAMGGFLGVKLAAAGQEVTFIDKGSRLDVIREKGLKLIMEDGSEYSAPNASVTGDFAEAGPQDAVILAVKVHDLPDVADKVPLLFGPRTFVVTIQNGIPWWYFQKHGGEYEGIRLKTLDPEGKLEENIPADRIVGCVAYPAAAVIGPGVVRQVEGRRFPDGELDGTESDRCRNLVGALTAAGFKSFILEDIRSEIWLKAWGNLSFNSISALTHATLEDICRFPETRSLAAGMMEEAQKIASKLGVTFRHTIERRIAGAEKVGPHKTSMLQDVEAGRSLETEALIGSVLELARLTKTAAPAVEAVYACTKLLNKTYIEAKAKICLVPLTPRRN